METNTVSHTRTRLQGDAQINHILDTTLQRESNLSSTQNKLRTTSVAEKTLREVLDLNHLQEEAPIHTGDQTEHLNVRFINTVQTSVKKSVREGFHKKKRQIIYILWIRGEGSSNVDKRE